MYGRRPTVGAMLERNPAFREFLNILTEIKLHPLLLRTRSRRCNQTLMNYASVGDCSQQAAGVLLHPRLCAILPPDRRPCQTLAMPRVVGFERSAVDQRVELRQRQRLRSNRQELEAMEASRRETAHLRRVGRSRRQGERKQVVHKPLRHYYRFLTHKIEINGEQKARSW